MEAQNEDKLPGNALDKLGRRSFVKGAGLAGMGLAGAAFAGARLGMFDKAPGAKALGIDSTQVHAATNINIEVANFALNLEYLEAEFYTRATTGKTLEEIGIPVTGVGQAGPTTGGKFVDLEPYGQDRERSGKLLSVAYEIAHDEQQHVLLLRSLLGDAAIAKPTINLDALGIGFDDWNQFLQLSRAFEDTGVSAYGGAAPLLTDPGILSYAVRIGLTEAYHASAIRLLIAENFVPTSPVDIEDFLPPPSGNQYFDLDKYALSLIRNTSQVLSIVYANSTSGTSKGGFFPNGFNGAITTV
jgi:hypothetical protein